MLADVLSHILNRSSLSPYMYIHIFYCVTYRMTHNHRILIYLAPQEKMNTTSLKVTCSCLNISYRWVCNRNLRHWITNHWIIEPKENGVRMLWNTVPKRGKSWIVVKKKEEWNEDTLYSQSFSFIVFLIMQSLIKNPMAACAISTLIYHLQTMPAHASTN